VSPLRVALTIAAVVAGVSVPALWLFFRWRFARRRSRIPSIAHQLEGPYRKYGEKRRK